MIDKLGLKITFYVLAIIGAGSIVIHEDVEKQQEILKIIDQPEQWQKLAQIYAGVEPTDRQTTVKLLDEKYCSPIIGSNWHGKSCRMPQPITDEFYDEMSNYWSYDSDYIKISNSTVHSRTFKITNQTLNWSMAQHTKSEYDLKWSIVNEN